MLLARKPRLGTRGRPLESRAAILQAAIREFAHEGVAGARTDAIARSAKVNKALLYYYFKDKEALYGAVLDHVFSGLSERVQEALSRDLSPKQKYLAYVGAHFDYVASSPMLPGILMREWMRAGRTRSPHISRVVEKYLRPTFLRLSKLIQEGIASGDFRPVDPMQFIPSSVALVVFYFAALPVISQMMPLDPLAPESIAARRAAVLDYVSAALFVPQKSRSEGRDM
jgi:TetR/AcrR family transcriptional regulator